MLTAVLVIDVWLADCLLAVRRRLTVSQSLLTQAGFEPVTQAQIYSGI